MEVVIFSISVREVSLLSGLPDFCSPESARDGAGAMARISAMCADLDEMFLAFITRALWLKNDKNQQM